ncbi:RrF2 family transcriptional regulator [Botrimarina hoheduenensis]|uniref:HTH-type transcriptional regulator CymR n=1 Tax=Botrimarina hoheduenensis TaxID=2528000 RepID=A0A5C5VS54_9BACT|nr:Rrf2 family transcriptional regulator [Botrimarina hoheduenensis]TWT40765.1 HTH-type transcriptional regulator CymR [Botrimarina hoheduenensis]
MSVSQTAEYALRAVVWLAQNPGEPQTTQQLADGTLVSSNYLPKVLQPLGRAEILTSQRGVNGGYTLARDPEELTVLEVINCVDPIQRIKRCPLRLNSHAGKLCPLHQMLDEAIGSIEQRFASETIAGLLRQETGSKPLCDTSPATFSLTLPTAKPADDVGD